MDSFLMPANLFLHIHSSFLRACAGQVEEVLKTMQAQ